MTSNWLSSVRAYSLILVLLGLVGYSSNPERAMTSLIMASGVGLLLYFSTCLPYRLLNTKRARFSYIIGISIYSVAVLYRGALAWISWYGGLESKLFVAVLLTTISVLGGAVACMLLRSPRGQGACLCSVAHGEKKVDNPGGKVEEATFAAGCFWGVEVAFRSLEGVLATEVGYTGGWKENPSYEEVCTDTTGHAEAVRVTYDATKIDYDSLLRCFWSIHDPTTLNRQGPDVGRQYRSAIFYHTEGQRQKAERSLEQLRHSERFQGRSIVTEIVPLVRFWPAEECHQKYYEKKNCCN